MAREFLLPDPGEGIHEADILEIHVSAGDEVKDGDPLFTVETDKAVVEIPSSFDGEIVEIMVETGTSLEVGEVLLTFEPVGGSQETPENVPEEDDREPGEDTPPSEQQDQQPVDAPAKETISAERPVPASPATRSLAKRLGVDLREIEGSGPDGRIEPEDVQTAAGSKQERATEEPSPTQGDEKGAEPFTEHGPVEWVDLRSVRRATARQMATSWREIPHVTHQDVADITGLEEFRLTHAEEIEKGGGRLTITAFLLKAAAAALAEHPRFNASLDADNDRLALKQYYNIGVAVDTEDGLVVPVIEDVDRKSIADLAVELTEVGERMRQGDRSLEDMQGGTFTITNPGGIGGTGFTPIINHPEVAILGAARARQVPVVRDVEPADGEDGRTFAVVPRLHLPLVLAFDHRVNDGADAARFMNSIKALLEDFSQFVLHG